ncbi:MAG: GAF domain-containing protein, partial [Anaerolineae bacterium]|nr:GAF domain-containing protein [Anaerolineae bacterium]
AVTVKRDELESLLKPKYLTSESYFFPIEELEQWYQPSISVLSAEYEGNRSVEPLGKRWWHDGDMLLVSIMGQGGELLGLMSLDRPYNNQRPERRTLEVLEIFAHQAATMMENTRLFQQIQHSADQEAQISNLLESIAGTLDLRELAESLALGLRELANFDHMSLVLYDESSDNFHYMTAGFRVSGEVVVHEDQHSTLERTALGRSFAERTTYTYANDAEAARNYDDLRTWMDRGEHSTIILPLSVGGMCLGVLHLGSAQPEMFQNPDTVQLLTRTVQLVASTVQSARLFNQALNLQVLNRSVVESIQQGIVVLDNSGHIISINEFMRSAYGWDDSARGLDLFEYQPDLSEYLKSELLAVLEDGQPRARIGQTTPSDASQIIVRNFYIYPLRYEDEIRGAVLLVDDVTERA